MKKCSSEINQFELADPVGQYNFGNKIPLIFSTELGNSGHSECSRAAHILS